VEGNEQKAQAMAFKVDGYMGFPPEVVGGHEIFLNLLDLYPIVDGKPDEKATPVRFVGITVGAPYSAGARLLGMIRMSTMLNWLQLMKADHQGLPYAAGEIQVTRGLRPPFDFIG